MSTNRKVKTTRRTKKILRTLMKRDRFAELYGYSTQHLGRILRRVSSEASFFDHSLQRLSELSRLAREAGAAIRMSGQGVTHGEPPLVVDPMPTGSGGMLTIVKGRQPGVKSLIQLGRNFPIQSMIAECIATEYSQLEERTLKSFPSPDV